MKLIFIGGHKRQCQVFLLIEKKTDNRITISVDEYALISFVRPTFTGYIVKIV